MFKRIAKITGLVLLAFVLIFGVVIGVMFLKGDFEEEVIKPTAINFSIENSELVFDAVESADRVYTFVIKAEPYNVTETECTITVTDPNLITFVTRQNGEWVKYNSSTFYINQPIYFKINKVTDENANLYNDGLLGIIVKDSSGLLKATMNLEIDRSITSISIKDRGVDTTNNTISNGLFGYEIGKDEPVVQQLEAIVEEDYPLEIITAPLRAVDAISTKGRKITEIYYVVDNTPKLLTHEGETVKIKVYDNDGKLIDDPEFTPCEFLKYDTAKGVYVLNSSQTGTYQFKLATYPTYDVQDMLAFDDEMSYVVRLNSGSMIIKDVEVVVTGTSADSIEFNQYGETTTINLLQNNGFVVNNGGVSDKHDLGLVLAKDKSGTEILGRYNQLQFLTSDNFEDKVNFAFKRYYKTTDPETDSEKLIASAGEALITLDASKKTATISNFGDVEGGEYSVELKYDDSALGWKLILTKDTTVLTFDLELDATGHIFNFKTILATVEGEPEGAIGKIKASVNGGDGFVYLETRQANCFIKTESEIVYGVETCGFKTFAKDKVYLAILNGENDLVNDKFVTAIDHNGADTTINIMPVEDLGEVKLYAIVVNDDGSWTYTIESYDLTINTVEMVITATNNGYASFTATVTESGIEYGKMGVDDLVNVLEGSYGKNQVVFFASEYSELTLATKPSDWGYFDVYKYDESTGYQLVTAEEEWTFGTVYYVKNNFEIIPGITKEKDGVVYNLLGKYEDGIFTNEIISNGANHYAKIYPAIINTKYLTEEGRLQTAKEYIQEFMRGATAKGTTTDGYSLTYDVNLTKNSTVYTNKGNDSYLMVSGAYNPNRTYYIYEGSEWKPAIITQEIIDAWNPEDRKYHESVHCKNIKEVYASYDEFVADSRNLLYGTKWDDVVVTISKDDVKATIYNQDGFNLFGASHYVIFDSYAIDSVVSNEESVHMKVYPSSNGMVFNEGVGLNLTITKMDYNYALESSGLSVNFDLKTNSQILAFSDYRFADGVSVTNSDIGGTYFDAEQAKMGDDFEIIAGHTDIALGWDETADDPINAKIPQLELVVNHNSAEEILRNIITGLTVEAVDCSSANPEGNNISSDILEIGTSVIDYVRADNECEENKTYYTRSDAEPYTYTKLEITEDIKNSWDVDDNYKKYYYQAIVTQFELHSALDDGHYIKFNYLYGGNVVATTVSKLYTVSRDITGYKIDTGRATIYTSVGTEFVGDVNNLEIQVDWESDNYKYTVYALDNEGNKLYSDNVLENPICADASQVFNLTTNAMNKGWIKILPFYAERPYFELNGDGYINFVDNTLASVKQNRSAGADGKLFTSDDSIATHTITVGDGSDATITKITVSLNTENFIYTEPNRGEKFSSTAKELAIDVNTFRYDTDTGSTDGTEAALDNEIEVSIGTNDYEVMQAGKDVTNDYFVYNEDGSLKIVTRDEPDYDRPLVNIYFDGGEGADNQWKIVRNNFDQIKLKLTFSTIKGDDVVNVEFNSPYTATPSATNITTTIYSGTTFVLATDGQPMDYAEEVEYSGNPSDYTDGNYYINVGDIYYLLGNHNYYTADNSYSDVEVEGETEQGYGYISGGKVVLIEVDAKICAGTLDTNANPLYTLKANTDESATFTISNGLTGNIGLKEGKYMFVVPEVTRKTNTNFAISFTYSGSTTRVTTLNLTILPNVIIQGKPSEQDLTLNDYDDKYYNLDGLKLASYSTEGKYYSYGTPTALENVDNIEYGVVYYKQTFEYVDGNTYRYDVDGKRYVLVDSEEDCEDLLHEYVALYTRVSNEQILTNGATYTETTSYIENNTYRYDADTNSYIALSQENFNTLLASGKKAYTTKIEDEQILNYYLTYTETTEYEKDITYKYNIADKTYTKVATEEDFKTEYQEVEDYIEGIKYFKDDGGSYTEIEINSLAEFENNKAITALYTVTKFYIRSNQLQVGIIENIGNYYANVMVYARSETQSLVGTFDFKIASLSQITNERGADIEIVANREITYTLEQLKHIFNLRRNKDKVGTLVDVEINEIYDHTAKLLINKKYETVDTYAEGCTYAYTTTDVYIEGNTYILDGEDYVLVESQEAFDTLVEGVEKFKFVKLTSEDDLTGLKLYKFSGISVYYNGFGQINEGKINLTYDGFVDFVNYTSVATYVLDGKAYDMTTGEVYTMKVLPYIIEPSTDVLLADRSYNLIGGSAPLFIANSSNEEEVGVKFFEFSSPEAVNYTITNEEDVYDIKFVKNGNYYTTTLPTTLTYNNGLKLDYEQVFTIVNSNEVNINYPFDVKDEDDVYGTFNTTLSQFTTSATDINIVDTLIDIALYNNVSQNDIYTPYDEELEEGNAYYYQNMMGEYVKTTTKVEGVNQYYVLADNWSSKIALGYDIALKNPNNITTINLSEDELLKLCRYTTTTYSVATREIGGATYYIYNTNTHAFEFVEDVVARAELPTGKYYVANNNEYVSDSISSIELVAVSSDYGVTNTQLESVKNSISFSNGTIKLDSNMITSGYLAFKVYSSTGAYGYYILKFINDTNFASVIDPNLSRRNAVITEPITTDTEVYGLISTKNSFVNASHINEDLLTEGYNNVYLFMVDCSDGAKIKVNGESRIYQQGERIVHDALLMPSNNTEHIELAVVVSNGASLVHICNYTLTLTPDVKVEENQTLIDDVINPDYYQYQAKALSYDFDNFVQVTTKPERWNEYAVYGQYYTYDSNTRAYTQLSEGANPTFEEGKYFYQLEEGKSTNVHALDKYFKVTNYDRTEDKLLYKVVINLGLGISSELRVADYIDTNANGRCDAGEELDNIVIYIDANANGTCNVGEEVVTIVNAGKDSTLTLNHPLGLAESVYFWITYTYDDGFQTHLKLTIDSIEFKDLTTIEVNGIGGTGNVFDTVFDLTNIIDGYRGQYSISYSIDDDQWINSGYKTTTEYIEGATYQLVGGRYIAVTSQTAFDGIKATGEDLYTPSISDTTVITGWDYAGYRLAFASSTANKSVILRVTLLDTIPNKQSDAVTLTIKPQILTEYNTSNSGDSDKNPVGVKLSNTLYAYGSYLNVEIKDDDTDSTIKIITIKDDTEYLTFKVRDFGKVKFDVYNASGESCNYLIDDLGNAVSTYELTTSNTLKFAHTLNNINLKVDITIYNAIESSNGKYVIIDGKYVEYNKDNASHTGKARYNVDMFTVNNSGDAITPLYISLQKSYDLVAAYRVDGAEYESVVNGEMLTFNGVAGLIKDEFFGTEDNATHYMQNANGAYVDYKGYVEYDGADGNHVGLTKYGLVTSEISNKLNFSRMAVKLASGGLYYGIASMSNIGLFSTDNPNKITEIETTDGDEIANGYLFACDAENSGINKIITFSNASGQIPLLNLDNKPIDGYKFIVYNEASDAHHSVAFNDTLLLQDTDSVPDNKADRVMITNKQLNTTDAKGNVVGIELAYLNYNPSVNGEDVNVVEVVIKNAQGNKLNSTISASNNASYISAIRLYDYRTEGYEIFKVYILTMNGVSAEIEVCVSDLEVTYGYNDGESSEAIFAGIQGKKLSAKAESSGKIRLQYEYLLSTEDTFESAGDVYTYDSATNTYTKLDVKPTEFEEGKYYIKDANRKLKYIGAVDGSITNQPIGMEPDYSSTNADMIEWTDESFAVRDIDTNYKYITLIFDVKVDEIIINKIFYVLYIQQEWVIGISDLTLDINTGVDLYLGNSSNIIDTTNNTTSIDVTNVKSDRVNNTLYVTLNRKYYTTTKEGKIVVATAPVAVNPTNFNNYLKLEISNKSASLEGDNKIKVNGSKIVVMGNPSGSFELTVLTSSGYKPNFPVVVTVKTYDKTLQTNSGLNIGQGPGFTSGTTIDLINTNPKEENQTNFAFNVYQRDSKFVTDDTGKSVSKEELKSIYSAGRFDNGVNIQYQTAIIPNISMAVSDINKLDWTDTATKAMYHISELKNTSWTGLNSQIVLPEVEVSTSSDTIKHSIVSIRLVVTYNGEAHEYFAHYKVYNPSELNVNAIYKNNKTIVYGEKAWLEDDGDAGTWINGSQIILMGNPGLYDLVKPLTDVPEDWGTNYYNYYEEDEHNGYKKVTLVYEADKYYKKTNTYTYVGPNPESADHAARKYYTASFVKAEGEYDSSEAYYIENGGVYTQVNDADKTEEAFNNELYYLQVYTLAEGTFDPAGTYYTPYELQTSPDAPTGWDTEGHTYYAVYEDLIQPVRAPEWDASKKYYQINSIAQYFINLKEPTGWGTENLYWTEDDVNGYIAVSTTAEFSNSTTYYTRSSVIGTKPDDWGTKNTYYTLSYGTYTPVPSNVEFDTGVTYYKFTLAYTPKYVFTTIINGAERYITNITYIDIGNPGTPNYALIGTLPHDATDGNGPLFRNSADMTFNVYNAESENLLIYTDSWKIKSNITIEPVVGEEGMLPLSMFFLNSEIGDELYNTGKIIAIYEEATNTNYLDAINIIGGSAVKQVKCYDVTNNHAEHGTDCGKDVFNQKINGFMLKEVTYELVGGGNVFAMEEVYYVLTGLPYAISFDYNGGTYYINLTIDDTAMMKDGTLSDSAVIDLLQFVNIYHTDSNNMFNASPAVLNENGNIDFDVSGVSGVLYDTETQCVKNTSSTWQDDAEYYIYIPAQDGSLNGTYEIVSDKPQEWANDYGDYYIKLNEKGNVSLADVDKLKENRSINGTVEFNWFKDKEVEISRPVQLYFNIVIKPKVLALDGGGNETEYMPYSQLIADAIDEGGTLSADTVNANETLKKELLNLITFKSKTVDVLSTTALGYWNITAKYVSGAVVGGYYEIVYNYSYNGEVYKRTLKMLGNQITSTSGSGDELLYDDEIVLTLNGVGSTSLDEAWFNGQEVLKKGLLDCIRFKGEVPDTDSMSDSELAKWSISTVRYDDYYKIKYNYTSGLESYTKTFKMSRIAPIVT